MEVRKVEQPDLYEACQSCIRKFPEMTKVDIGRTRPWSFYLCNECKNELSHKLILPSEALGGVIVATAILGPDNDSIGIHVSFNDGTYKLSDLGEAFGFLEMHGIEDAHELPVMKALLKSFAVNKYNLVGMELQWKSKDPPTWLEIVNMAVIINVIKYARTYLQYIG